MILRTIESELRAVEVSGGSSRSPVQGSSWSCFLRRASSTRRSFVAGKCDFPVGCTQMRFEKMPSVYSVIQNIWLATVR